MPVLVEAQSLVKRFSGVAALNGVDFRVEEHEIVDDTLVIMTTDHGLAFPDAKCTMYDRGIGVLLLVRGPGGFARGRVCDALVSHLDVRLAALGGSSNEQTVGMVSEPADQSPFLVRKFRARGASPPTRRRWPKPRRSAP